jgi:hypothetical protein
VTYTELLAQIERQEAGKPKPARVPVQVDLFPTHLALARNQQHQAEVMAFRLKKSSRQRQGQG